METFLRLALAVIVFGVLLSLYFVLLAAVGHTFSLHDQITHGGRSILDHTATCRGWFARKHLCGW